MKTLDHKYLLSILNYNSQTGVFTWKHHRRGVNLDRVAGVIGTQGYRLIRIDGELYKAGRLAWFYTHDKWPEIIDHIDRDKANDALHNLRDVDQASNMQNTDRHKNRVGVCFNKRASSWFVYLDRPNKSRINVGYRKTKEEALALLEKAREDYSDL